MKKLTILTLTAATLAMSAGVASAQVRPDFRGPDGRYESRWYDSRGQWQNVNRRQAELDRRIDRGVRARQITRTEAVRLRAEFRQIARLEATYRRGGLSNWERADLDRRFDILATRIRWERNDRNYGYGYGRR